MRLLAVTAALALLFAVSPAIAQQAEPSSDIGWEDVNTREDTFRRVAQTLADINEPFARSNYMAMSSDSDWAMGILEAGIRQVADLRDKLASNPYVRISSFTIGIPWGVSVEFSFPPQAGE